MHRLQRALDIARKVDRRRRRPRVRRPISPPAARCSSAFIGRSGSAETAARDIGDDVADAPRAPRARFQRSPPSARERSPCEVALEAAGRRAALALACRMTLIGFATISSAPCGWMQPARWICSRSQLERSADPNAGAADGGCGTEPSSPADDLRRRFRTDRSLYLFSLTCRVWRLKPRYRAASVRLPRLLASASSILRRSIASTDALTTASSESLGSDSPPTSSPRSVAEPLRVANRASVTSRNSRPTWRRLGVRVADGGNFHLGQRAELALEAARMHPDAAVALHHAQDDGNVGAGLRKPALQVLSDDRAFDADLGEIEKCVVGATNLAFTIDDHEAVGQALEDLRRGWRLSAVRRGAAAHGRHLEQIERVGLARHHRGAQAPLRRSSGRCSAMLGARPCARASSSASRSARAVAAGEIGEKFGSGHDPQPRDAATLASTTRRLVVRTSADRLVRGVEHGAIARSRCRAASSNPARAPAARRRAAPAGRRSICRIAADGDEAARSRRRLTVVYSIGNSRPLGQQLLDLEARGMPLCAKPP